MGDSDAKTPGREALSPAIGPMRKAAEQAVDEAMEDQFPSFPEDRVSGSGPPRNGRCERKALATVGEVNVRVPRDRLSLFEERAIGRHRRGGRRPGRRDRGPLRPGDVALGHKPVPFRGIGRRGVGEARPRDREGKLRRGREAQSQETAEMRVSSNYPMSSLIGL